MNTDRNQSDPNAVVIASYLEDDSVPDLYAKAWSSCQPVQITHYWSGLPAPANRHAEVRLCWNDKALHVRFVCEQREPLVIASEPATDKKTIGLWDRDVCEIFLAVDAKDPARYFEFEVAPTGEWVDLAIQMTPAGKETEWDYSSGMKTAASIEGKRFLVGISIPWSLRLPTPNVADEWRTNLFRCVGADEATRYLAWRPTRTPVPNFHVPEVFGLLRFA